MKIYYDLKDLKAVRPVVTIGTFDGVHLGHRKILGRLTEIAAATGGESLLFTFYPHPRQVLSPDEHNLRLITTLEEKVELLGKAGIDHLVVYPFSREFAALTYREFVREILVEKIGTSCLVVGYDHKFGKNREGDYEYLKECARNYNFRIEKLDPLLINEAHVSSTRIRQALEAGDIAGANRYLGYSYELHGQVVEGKKVGRKLGFPTANIEATEVTKLIPGYGVYAVRIRVAGETWKGMLNIGSRPTFNQNADNRSIEVNIFGFEGSLYGEKITLFFDGKIREEQKFGSVKALVAQLRNDREKALEILAGS